MMGHFLGLGPMKELKVDGPWHMALVTLSLVFVEAARYLEKNMSPKPWVCPSCTTLQWWGLGWVTSHLWA